LEIENLKARPDIKAAKLCRDKTLLWNIKIQFEDWKEDLKLSLKFIVCGFVLGR